MTVNCRKCLPDKGQVFSTEETTLMTHYLPHRLVRAIGKTPCCFFEHKVEKLTGFIVFFDIVGFTPIVARHIESGKDVGILSDILKQYYTIIIDEVRAMGGTVFQFAGDSLLISFDKLYGETIKETLRRTMYCVHNTRAKSKKYNQSYGEKNGFILSPKIGVGQGSFYQILLGDQTTHITPIIAGQAVNEAVCCEKMCKKNQIILGEKTLASLIEFGMSSYTEITPLCAFLKELPEEFLKNISPPGFCKDEVLFENPRYYKRANAFINPTIQQQIKSHYKGFSGEYRDITCVMIHLEGSFFNAENDFGIMEGFSNLNTIYQIIQDKTTKYGGFCLKPDISDKGTVFPILFGAPFALENKERTAVIFSNEILTREKDLPFIDYISIGLATGKVYCGEFGGKLRKDFSVVGTTINLAARLMMLKEQSGIFMDAATKRIVESICTLKQTTSIPLKGFSLTQEVYRLHSIKNKQKGLTNNSGMIGRDRELSSLLDKFIKAKEGSVEILPVIGDAGMGKSFLIDTFITSIQKEFKGSSILIGDCFQYEESTLFFPWRTILKEILNITQTDSLEEVYKKLKFQFQKYFKGKETEWIGFFLNMLGYQFDEDKLTKETDMAIKQEKFFSLAYRIVIQEAKKNPCILILGDIHWSDNISLKMLEYFINGRKEAPLLIIPVSREADKIVKLFKQYDIPILFLRQLKREDAKELSKILLNMKESEDLLIEKIINTSDCNPFFIENIVQNMKENGVLVEDTDNKNFLSKDVSNVTIPSSIQNIILSRLNSLLFEEQIIFKTASVIGRSFLAEILRTLCPEGISEYVLFNALENFETHNLILKERDEQSSYFFKHITIRDVVYNTILESTKKELNKMLFLYLEKNYRKTIQSVVERLEYHAYEAESYENVLKYALLSAKKAEHLFSNFDAITHYKSALSALEHLNPENKENTKNQILLSLATVYRKNSDYSEAFTIYNSLFETEKRVWFKSAILQGLGQSYQEQGQFEKAVESLEKAIKLLGKKAPHSMFSTYLSIFFEVIYQTYITIIKKNEVKQRSQEDRCFAEMRADILFVLSKLYYFGHTEKVAWAAIKNFNNGIKIVDSKERWCVTLADYATTLVSVGFTKLGLKYFKSAEDVAYKTKSQKIISIFKARYAYYFLFYNRPEKSIELLESSVNYLRSIGEMWEVMTALGALAQNYFLISNFEESEKAYLECERIARKLNSTMHIGWSFNKVPFIQYVRGDIDQNSAIEKLHQGIAISEQAYDHMTLCIHYGHLSYISVRENKPKQALHYANKIMEENSKYKVNIPHVKISYVNAVEGYIFAMEKENSIVKTAGIMQKAEKALKKATKQGKTFKLIEGPACRARARLFLYKNKHEKARQQCDLSLEILKNSPYLFEYAQTLSFAARCFPDKESFYNNESERIYKQINIRSFI